MLKRRNTYMPGGAGPLPAAHVMGNRAGLLFFSLQLGYGAALIVKASRRLSDPAWVGLGAMGFTFAAAALLFIWAVMASLRDGRSMRNSRLLHAASVLMLVGAVCMATGMIISQTRPKPAESTSADRNLPEDRRYGRTARAPSSNKPE